jgi:hypothetical protein
MQEPPTHAEATHATGAPHVPVEEQVWMPLPEHCVAPGVHTPVQPPLTQAWFEHATLSVDQVPSDWHTW